MCEDARNNYLREIDEFITSKSQLLEKICEDIGWSAEPQSRKSEKSNYVTCPIESGHLVSPSKLEDHVNQCKLRHGNYSEDDVPFPQCFDGGGVSISLGAEDHLSVLQSAGQLGMCSPTDIEVPLSASRLQSSFTPQQRLSLYEHIVQNTSSSTSSLPLTELDLAFEAGSARAAGGSKSFLEALAEQRDAKRRRLNYRQAKHVHTKHKSQTEVAREVISNQMELYQQWLQQQTNEQLGDDNNHSMEKMPDMMKHQDIQYDGKSKLKESFSHSSVSANQAYFKQQRNQHYHGNSKSRHREENFSVHTQGQEDVRRRDSNSKSSHREDRRDRDHHKSRGEHKRDKHGKKRHHSRSSDHHRHSKRS